MMSCLNFVKPRHRMTIYLEVSNVIWLIGTNFTSFGSFLFSGKFTQCVGYMWCDLVKMFGTGSDYKIIFTRPLNYVRHFQKKGSYDVLAWQNASKSSFSNPLVLLAAPHKYTVRLRPPSPSCPPFTCPGQIIPTLCLSFMPWHKKARGIGNLQVYSP